MAAFPSVFGAVHGEGEGHEVLLDPLQLCRIREKTS